MTATRLPGTGGLPAQLQDLDPSETYLYQGVQRRTLVQTLDLGWQLLAGFSAGELKRVSAEQLARHHNATT